MNYMVAFDCEVVAVHIDEGVHFTISDIKTFAEKSTGEKVVDIVEVRDDELQYYCIDGRVYIGKDNESEVKRIING